MFVLLFPGLVLDIIDFHCDVCQLAKYYQASFPLYNTKSSASFCFIHTDGYGWGRFTFIILVEISGLYLLLMIALNCVTVLDEKLTGMSSFFCVSNFL